MEVQVTPEILNDLSIKPWDSCGCYIHRAVTEQLGVECEANEVYIEINDKQYYCSPSLAHWQLTLCRYDPDETPPLDVVNPITIVFEEVDIEVDGDHYDGRARMVGELQQ